MLSHPNGQAPHCWTLKMKAQRSFQMTTLTHLTIQGHIPEHRIFSILIRTRI